MGCAQGTDRPYTARPLAMGVGRYHGHKVRYRKKKRGGGCVRLHCPADPVFFPKRLLRIEKFRAPVDFPIQFIQDFYRATPKTTSCLFPAHSY